MLGVPNARYVATSKTNQQNKAKSRFKQKQQRSVQWDGRPGGLGEQRNSHSQSKWAQLGVFIEFSRYAKEENRKP